MIGRMKRLLTQLQLSNYDTNGTWILECDSGFQMVFGRVREMLLLNASLHVDIIGPRRSTLKTQPEEIVPTVFNSGRARWIEVDLIPNAAVTRYDFNFKQVSEALQFKSPDHQKYDAMYANDPMLLRHYKALFFIDSKYRPRFYVHSHFVDVEEAPKFPREISLWLGQCEAALKADYNFWQCETAMLQFFDSMGKWFTQDVVDDVRAKSLPSDDGYSIEEITSPFNACKMRFTVKEWQEKTNGKVVLFFPNRISPSSGDYTNGMRWMFDILPQLRAARQDFVIVCGNPNLKFTNDELLQRCGKDGYIKLHDFTLNRDEYKFVARNSHIALGLYDKDTYGGTAARECVELGCLPLWLDKSEYSSLAREAGCGHYVLARPDWTDIVDVADRMIDDFVNYDPGPRTFVGQLRNVVRARCAYENTVRKMMKLMDLLPSGAITSMAGGDNLARFGDNNPPTGA